MKAPIILSLLSLTCIACSTTEAILAESVQSETTCPDVMGTTAMISSGADCSVLIDFYGSQDFTSRWLVTIKNDSEMVEYTTSDPSYGAIFTAGQAESVWFDGPIEIEVTVFGEGGDTETLRYVCDCQ